MVRKRWIYVARTLISPGDEVIVLDPNYVAYEPAILMAGGVPVRIELTQDNDFKLLPEDLERRDQRPYQGNHSQLPVEPDRVA